MMSGEYGDVRVREIYGEREGKIGYVLVRVFSRLISVRGRSTD
jgi:hypothetical protein